MLLVNAWGNVSMLRGWPRVMMDKGSGLLWVCAGHLGPKILYHIYLYFCSLPYKGAD